MKHIIIVAGGKGLRMGGDISKQFLHIKGKPILMRTIEAFYNYDKNITIVVVLPKDLIAFWKELCTKCDFQVPHTITEGGKTRFHSSQNGLKALPKNATGWVGFHDGVRPFVSSDTIDKCFKAAQKYGAAIAVTPVIDTLRYVGNDFPQRNVLRDDYRCVQTPQVFEISIAQKAFEQPYSETFTDDASVIEHIGHSITMIEGNRENIKITTPFDLAIAKSILENEEK